MLRPEESEQSVEIAHRPWDGFGSPADGSARDPLGSGRRPRLVDLMCCQGGASKGYAVAGFEVVGIDIDPQPHYPFEFHQADVTELRAEPGGWLWIGGFCLGRFDAAHASPPCQAKTKCQKIRGREHPRLIGTTRDLLERLGVPYVIENVVPEDPASDPDPLIDPVMLCGAMFGVETYRHRLFESNVHLIVPEHPEHVARTTKMGRPPQPGEFMHVVGNFSGAARARGVMGMPWATRDGLREAIPPAYTEHLGRQIAAHVDVCTRPGQTP